MHYIPIYNFINYIILYNIRLLERNFNHIRKYLYFKYKYIIKIFIFSCGSFHLKKTKQYIHGFINLDTINNYLYFNLYN